MPKAVLMVAALVVTIALVVPTVGEAAQPGAVAALRPA